jgi:hypothetical protein
VVRRRRCRGTERLDENIANSLKFRLLKGHDRQTHGSQFGAIAGSPGWNGGLPELAFVGCLIGRRLVVKFAAVDPVGFAQDWSVLSYPLRRMFCHRDAKEVCHGIYRRRHRPSS